MGKYGVWIVLISMVNIKGALSEECPITDKQVPANAVSFCTESTVKGINLTIGTWLAPHDSTWNCQCNINTTHSWTGSYHVYRQGNPVECSIALSSSDGYITNNCTSQTLGQLNEPHSVRLTKNTVQKGISVCFVIKGTAEFSIRCNMNTHTSFTGNPDATNTGVTAGQQDTSPNNEGTLSTNERTTTSLETHDININNNEINTAAIAGGVVAAVVVVIVVIIIVICIIRRRKSKQAEDPKTEETVQKDPDYDETVMTENVMYHVGMNAVPARAQMASPGNEYSQVHKPNAKMGTEEDTKYVYSQVQKPSKNKSDISEEPHSPDVLLKEGYSEVFDSSDDAGYHVYRQPDSPTNSNPQAGKGETTPAGVSGYDYIDESKMLSDGTLQKRKVSDASSQHYDYVSTSALEK